MSEYWDKHLLFYERATFEKEARDVIELIKDKTNKRTP